MVENKYILLKNMTAIVFSFIIIISIFFAKYKFISPLRELAPPLNINLYNSFVKYSIPIFIVTLLVGLRYEVGVDYPVYKEIYEYNISEDFSKSLDESGVESLFTCICVILHKLDVPYYGMFIIMTFIPLCFYYLSFKDKNEILIPTTICLYFSGVFFWYMNIMRQGIAFFIILYAVNFIIKRSFPKFIFFILLASGFHISSLIFIPLYLLTYIKKNLFNKTVSLILYFITWIFSKQLQYILLLIVSPFLSGDYIKYYYIIDEWEMTGGSGLGVLALHIADIMLIITSSLCYKFAHNKRYDIYYNIFFLGSLISNIAGLNMILSRIPFCLISMRIVVSGFMFWCIYNNWKQIQSQYRIAFIICISCYSAYFLGNLINLDYNFITL